MSSESDDDFSYTNSVSVLKALRKKDVNVSEENEKSKGDAITFIDSPEVLNRRRKVLRSTNIIEEDSNDSDLAIISVEVENKTQCTVISDDEVDKSLNIISTIDDYLKNGGKKRGKKPITRSNKKVAKTRRNTRSITNKKKSSAPIQSGTAGSKTAKIVTVIDDSEDSNNEENINFDVTVKVWWKSQCVEKFTIKRFEKVSVIYEHFAKKENLLEDRLFFTIRDRIVSKSDTPDSLNINAATIIEGGILSEEQNFTSTGNQEDTDKIKLKVLMGDRKHPLMIAMKMTDRMNVLMYLCATELTLPCNALKFYFDGDVITSNDTPISLQLEGGECIDCVQK